VLAGRLVLDEVVAPGRVTVEDGWIVEVAVEDEGGVGAAEGATAGSTASDPRGAASRPFLAPGFVDVHVHGWGGHDAMGDDAALDGMARALLRQGVTSFLPTAVSAPLETLAAFAERVRGWMPTSPGDGADPLGFNLEGPFLAPARRGAHDPRCLLSPSEVRPDELDRLVDGLAVITIAPEIPGALDLIGWLAARGVAVSLGHSAADLAEARAGFAAGARSTTHLFNAMTGLDHRAPGLAAAALEDDSVFVELIADGHHVHPALWPLVRRIKPADRLVLVSDAISPAGTGDGHVRLGGLEVEVAGGRATLAGTATLAGSVIALDTAVRHLVESGASLPSAVAAASRDPLALLGVVDRGRIAVGQRADIVELDDALRVRRVMRAGRWHAERTV
jgi:N-acetylglucosamine-6-phosphate deacetylase